MDALSCLAPHAALLPCGGAFTDADITRALHFSMPDSSSSSSAVSSSSPFLADFGGACGGGGFVGSAPPPPPTMPAITCDSVLVADSARPVKRHQQQQQLGLGPAGGGAGKRRSRASKRAPTAYISTDPANFRLMVQQVTGVQADPASLADGSILPTITAPFDASSLHLLDTTSPNVIAAFAAANPLLQAAAASEQAAAAALHQQQPCFPTLDSSWSAVMYEGSELL